MIKVRRVYFKFYDDRMNHTNKYAGWKEFKGKDGNLQALEYARRKNLYKYDIKIVEKKETKKIKMLSDSINIIIDKFVLEQQQDIKDFEIYLKYMTSQDGNWIEVEAHDTTTEEINFLYDYEYNNFSEEEIKIMFDKVENKNVKIENLGVCAV